MDSDLKPSLVMRQDNYQVLFVCERRMESTNDGKRRSSQAGFERSQETIRCRPERRTLNLSYGGLRNKSRVGTISS